MDYTSNPSSQAKDVHFKLLNDSMCSCLCSQLGRGLHIQPLKPSLSGCPRSRGPGISGIRLIRAGVADMFYHDKESQSNKKMSRLVKAWEDWADIGVLVKHKEIWADQTKEVQAEKRREYGASDSFPEA